MASKGKELALDGRDLINKLTDDIIVQILGLLDTKNAVATSLLSRRWRELYQFLYHFHCVMGFNVQPRDSEEAQDKVINYLESLYKIICTVRDLKSLIIEFDLFETNCDEWLNGCVVSASFRKMEHLKLLNRGRQYYEVPFGSIYCRQNDFLQSLALSRCLLIPSPPSWTFRNFRSLKKLELYHCFFYDRILVGGESDEEADAFDPQKNFAEDRFVALLESCPMLENLTMEHCEVYPMLRINPSCLHLKQVIMSHCVADLVEIANAPKLERVECTMKHPVSIVSLPCLNHFKLEYLEDMNMFVGLDGISMNAPNLETLILCFADGTIRLDQEECSFPFRKLKSLVVDAKRREMCNLFWIGLIMELAPFVEALELRIDRKFFSDDLVEMLEQPSNFSHNRLKELKITGFEGDAMDMNLVSFVLERAYTLERVILSREGTLIESEMTEQIGTLEHLKERINSNAQITLK